jgi:hypothetical protein
MAGVVSKVSAAARKKIKEIKEVVDLKGEIKKLEDKSDPTPSDEKKLSKLRSRLRIAQGLSAPPTTTRRTNLGTEIQTTGRTTPAPEKAIGSAPGTRGTLADASTDASAAPSKDYQGSGSRMSQEKRAPMTDIRKEYDDLTPGRRNAELMKYANGESTKFAGVIEQRNSKDGDLDFLTKQLTKRNKGGVIKKGYMGGGMANGKKHSYVAGGYVTDMMGKKKK